MSGTNRVERLPLQAVKIEGHLDRVKFDDPNLVLIEPAPVCNPTDPAVNQLIEIMQATSDKLHRYLDDVRMELRPANDNRRTNVFVRLRFDFSEIIEELRQSTKYSTPDSFAAYESANFNVKVWDNQWVSTVPFIIQLISNTMQGTDEIPVFDGDPCHVANPEDCANRNGQIKKYVSHVALDRNWFNQLLIASPQAGKTGCFVLQHVFCHVFNFVYNREIEAGLRDPIMPMTLLPSRKEMRNNFYNDLQVFLKIFGKVKVQVLDEAGERVLASANLNRVYEQGTKDVVARMKHELQSNKNLAEGIKLKLEGNSKCSVEQLSDSWAETTPDEREKAKQWVDSICSLVDSSMDINKAAAQLSQRFSCPIDKPESVQAYVDLGVELASKFHLVAALLNDEGQYGCGLDSVIYKKLEKASLFADDAKGFYSTVTATPDMFNGTNTFYRSIFRYPDGKLYVGQPYWMGKLLHHDVRLVVAPEIISFAEAAIKYDLPHLANYVETDVSSSRKFNSRRKSGTYFAGKWYQEMSFNAGRYPFPWAKTNRMTLPENYAEYANHTEYKDAVMNDFAQLPIKMIQHEIKYGPNAGFVPGDVVGGEIKQQAAGVLIRFLSAGDVTDFTQYFRTHLREARAAGLKIKVLSYNNSAENRRLIDELDREGVISRDVTSEASDTFTRLREKEIKNACTFEEFIKASCIPDDCHIIALTTGKLTMAVRAPRRCCFSIATPTHPASLDTDSVVQGVAARLWGVEKNPSCTVMSWQAAEFFACREDTLGNVNPNCKWKDKKASNGVHGNSLRLSFSDAMKIAEGNGMHDIVAALRRLREFVKNETNRSSKLGRNVIAQTGDHRWKMKFNPVTKKVEEISKFKASEDIRHSREIYALLNSEKFLNAVEQKLASFGHINRKLLRLGETIPVSRTIKGVKGIKDSHYVVGSEKGQMYANTQFRCEGDTSWRVPNNFSYDNQQFNLLLRWVDNDGVFQGWEWGNDELRIPKYQGSGYFDVVELHFVLSNNRLTGNHRVVPMPGTVPGDLRTAGAKNERNQGVLGYDDATS
jgi:hypothetical protein